MPPPAQGPRRGRWRQSGGAALFGEGVEVGVGGGVVGLADGAEGAGDRRIQDERGQVAVAGEVVEVAGGRELGPQHGLQGVGVHGVEEPVVEDAGGVHDGVDGVFGQQVGERVPVGGVAGGEDKVRAGAGQGLLETGGARRSGA